MSPTVRAASTCAYWPPCLRQRLSEDGHWPDGGKSGPSSLASPHLCAGRYEWQAQGPLLPQGTDWLHAQRQKQHIPRTAVIRPGPKTSEWVVMLEGATRAVDLCLLQLRMTRPASGTRSLVHPLQNLRPAQPGTRQ